MLATPSLWVNSEGTCTLKYYIPWMHCGFVSKGFLLKFCPMPSIIYTSCPKSRKSIAEFFGSLILWCVGRLSTNLFSCYVHMIRAQAGDPASRFLSRLPQEFLREQGQPGTLCTFVFSTVRKTAYACIVFSKAACSLGFPVFWDLCWRHTNIHVGV